MVYAQCTMNWENPNDEAVRKLLTEARTIAVVGCSPNPERSSHQIASFLLDQGYRMIPVHPAAREVHGQKAYASLLDIPKDVHVDIVDVFREPEATPLVAEQAVKIGAGALWLQQGIVNEDAYRISTAGGLACVMDQCIAVAYRLLMHD
ncbi:MAG: CoA-binding protein [Mariprofundaceae bacterium]